MQAPTIYADFNNGDEKGRLRLSVFGAIESIRDQGLVLRVGMQVIVSDGELEADAVLDWSEEEGTWVAAIDWEQIRDV